MVTVLLSKVGIKPINCCVSSVAAKITLLSKCWKCRHSRNLSYLEAIGDFKIINNVYKLAEENNTKTNQTETKESEHK